MLQFREILHLALAVRDPLQNLQHTFGALTTRNALAAGFMLRESEEELGKGHHAGAGVSDHHAARAHHGTEGAQVFVVDCRVEAIGGNAAA